MGPPYRGGLAARRFERPAHRRPVAGNRGASDAEEIHGMFEDLSVWVKQDKVVDARV